MSHAPSVDTGKLLELRYRNGLSYEHIAEHVGLAVGTVFQRLKRFESLFDLADGVKEFEVRESGILAGIRTKLLAHIAEGLTAENAHDKVSPYQAVGMYGILFDKQRILDGRSTANIAVLTQIVETGQEPGDKALRKLSVDGEQPNNFRHNTERVSENTIVNDIKGGE